MIAVETHHFVTKDIVILVKNVTFVTTELMAPAARAEMDFPPKKMAHVELLNVDNFTFYLINLVGKSNTFHARRKNVLLYSI